MPTCSLPFAILLLAVPGFVAADEPLPLTTLSDTTAKFTRPEKPYAVLKRGDVEMIVVDNSAVDDKALPKHRAGYSGVASLQHAQRRASLFVPNFAGLNFEHILDGTTHKQAVLRGQPRHGAGADVSAGGPRAAGAVAERRRERGIRRGILRISSRITWWIGAISS